jgi:hypothetical protein
MLHRGHFARGARKGRRKMSDEIVLPMAREKLKRLMGE